MEIPRAVLRLESYLRNPLSNMTSEEREALHLLLSHYRLLLILVKKMSK